MRIDNSAFTIYQDCPLKYWEKYVRPNHGDNGELKLGIERVGPKPDRDFGTRFHQLLHQLRAGYVGIPVPDFPEWPDDYIESECQRTLAGYLAAYPVEPLTFISAERTEVVALEGTGHELTVKIDGVVRHCDGTIGPLDTKTERPGSPYNEAEAWSARTQATLYLYALAKLYPEERVSRMVVDVVTRGNSKRAPGFRRMDDISRTPSQLAETVKNVARVCEEIERHHREGWWPRNENRCKDGWKKCDFFELHVVGESEQTLKLYRPAEPYLSI